MEEEKEKEEDQKEQKEEQAEEEAESLMTPWFQCSSVLMVPRVLMMPPLWGLMCF